MRKFISILASAAMLLGAVSCDEVLKPEDLTDEQIQECYETIQGTYQGTVQYTNYSTEDDMETATDNCSWSFTSKSSMKFTELTAGILARRIISQDDAALKEALMNYGPLSISAEITFFCQIPVAFYITPDPVKFKLTYGGATHDIEIGFSTDTGIFSCGYYYRDLKGMQLQLLESYLTVDGGANKLYSTFPLVFSYNIDSTE